MFDEMLIPVADNPRIDLFTAQTKGPDDQALLVIHGGPDWDHSYLRDPLYKLAGAYRVVMADMRGCGRSTTGLAPGEHTPDNVVRDFVALLDVLGLPRVDVLGFSYGGIIAQRLTLTHPGRVRKLIVASSSVVPVPDNAFDGWTSATSAAPTRPPNWPRCKPARRCPARSSPAPGRRRLRRRTSGVPKVSLDTWSGSHRCASRTRGWDRGSPARSRRRACPTPRPGSRRWGCRSCCCTGGKT
jgi:pimeloyl-ACP methyl ester carboxylesterase